MEMLCVCVWMRTTLCLFERETEHVQVRVCGWWSRIPVPRAGFLTSNLYDGT